jgi:mono/diheme cytochrome c family protein
MAMYPNVAQADPMAEFVTDQELTDILTWLDALPHPATGQALYQDFCGNCHGPTNPSGGAVAVSIVGKTIAEIEMKVRGGVGTDVSLRQGYMPAEPVEKLSAAELTLIEQFLQAK